MRVALGADHGGLDIKNMLVSRLNTLYEIIDLGAKEFHKEDDYPEFARAVAEAIVSGKADRGILACGSGVGACVAANKIPGARASLCHDTYSAHQGVEHDDMNILCLGGRVIGLEMAYELAEVFLKARFSGEPRFIRRLEIVRDIERRFLSREE